MTSDRLRFFAASVVSVSLPPARAELLHVPMLPDVERAEQIGEFWSSPQSRTSPNS